MFASAMAGSGVGLGRGWNLRVSFIVSIKQMGQFHFLSLQVFWSPYSSYSMVPGKRSTLQVPWMFSKHMPMVHKKTPSNKVCWISYFE